MLCRNLANRNKRVSFRRCKSELCKIQVFVSEIHLGTKIKRPFDLIYHACINHFLRSVRKYTSTILTVSKLKIDFLKICIDFSKVTKKWSRIKIKWSRFFQKWSIQSINLTHFGCPSLEIHFKCIYSIEKNVKNTYQFWELCGIQQVKRKCGNQV